MVEVHPSTRIRATIIGFGITAAVAETVRAAVTEPASWPLAAVAGILIVGIVALIAHAYFQRVRIMLDAGGISYRPLLGPTRRIPIQSIDVVVVVPILKPNLLPLLDRVAILGLDRHAFARLNASSWQPERLTRLLAELGTKVVFLEPTPGHQLARMRPEIFRWPELHPVAFLSWLTVGVGIFILVVGLIVIGPP